VNKTEIFPGAIISSKWQDGRLEAISNNGVVIRIEPITPHIIRVRYGTERYYEEDFSYALDPKFKQSPGDLSFDEGPDVIEIKTTAVKCRLCKADSLVTFLDLDDHVIMTSFRCLNIHIHLKSTMALETSLLNST